MNSPAAASVLRQTLFMRMDVGRAIAGKRQLRIAKQIGDCARTSMICSPQQLQIQEQAMTTDDHLQESAQTSYKWKIVQILIMTLAGVLLLIARQLQVF
jgi:hypothetical protein